MPDDYRESIKSMASCFWALSLLGAEQMAGIFCQGDGAPPRLPTVRALEPITRATEAQFGEVSKAVFQAGEQWQRGLVDVMFGLATGDALTPRYLTKMALDVLQQSVAVGKWLVPGQENALAWQELQNKLQAFSLFEHVDVILQRPSEPQCSLTALVTQAAALGPYVGIWALEGLGRYYAEMAWEARGTPQHLLTAEHVRDLPASSLIPLHTGMGVSLADRLLAILTPHSADAAIDTVLGQFMALCQQNSRDGYAGAALEALGLVTRLRYPQLLYSVDRRLAMIAPESLDYFWHGVGRGLYFLPLNVLPCSSSTWRAIDMAQTEAPHALGRRNALAGLAWPLTLVNIRHPAILETLLHQYGAALTASDAFSTGVSTALMIWYDIAGSDPYLTAFLRHQPNPSQPCLAQLWDTQVRQPSHQALQQYYGVLKAHHGLGEVFRYQPLAALVNRLKGESVR